MVNVFVKMWANFGMNDQINNVKYEEILVIVKYDEWMVIIEHQPIFKP